MSAKVTFYFVSLALLLTTALLSGCKFTQSEAIPTQEKDRTKGTPIALADSNLNSPLVSAWYYPASDYQAVMDMAKADARCESIEATTPPRNIRYIDAHQLVASGSSLDCAFNFAGPQYHPDGTPIKLVVVYGHSPNETILDYPNGSPNCHGIAMNTRDWGPALVVKDLAIRGRYNDWSSSQRTIPLGNDTTVGRTAWDTAIWAVGEGSLACVKNVSISNFYYGTQSIRNAWIRADHVNIQNSGDGAFFSYAGGKTIVRNSYAGYSTDFSRGLGFGLVAETLHWNYRYPDNNEVASYTVLQCRDEIFSNEGRFGLMTQRTAIAAPNSEALWGNSKEQRDQWEHYLDTIDAWHLCLVRISQAIAPRERSFIYADNVLVEGNRVGGIFANFGADIVASNVKVTGSRAIGPNGSSVQWFDNANLNRMSVAEAGKYIQGAGVVARYGSRIRIDGNSFITKNLFGVSAWRGASVSAVGVKVWDNSYYGFHAMREGFINATRSWAFGPLQPYHFAVQVDNPSAIRVDASLTPNPGGVRLWQMPPFMASIPFEVTYGLGPIWVTPSYNPATLDFNTDIFKIRPDQSPRGLYYYE